MKKDKIIRDNHQAWLEDAGFEELMDGVWFDPESKTLYAMRNSIVKQVDFNHQDTLDLIYQSGWDGDVLEWAKNRRNV